MKRKEKDEKESQKKNKKKISLLPSPHAINSILYIYFFLSQERTKGRRIEKEREHFDEQYEWQSFFRT